MGDYVNKFAVIRALLKDFKGERNTLDSVVEIIDDMPPTDVTHVVHGRWEYHTGGYVVCSECGEATPWIYASLYCGHCGAKMDRE